MVDGLFERIESDGDEDPATLTHDLRFHEATALTPRLLERLHWFGGRSDQVLYILPGPDPAGRTALRL